MKILQYFYDRNASSTSRFGKKGSAVKISDVKKELKSVHSLNQTQVHSNLTYLIGRKWVNTFDVQKIVHVKGGTIPSTVTWYEIAPQGIEKIEGDSEFKGEERYKGINITATGSNIIALGDGNVVNATFSALHSELNQLKQSVSESSNFTEKQKLDLAVDIESIKDQLAKDQPNKTVIQTLWAGIQIAVTAADMANLIHKITPFLSGLLT